MKKKMVLLVVLGLVSLAVAGSEYWSYTSTTVTATNVYAPALTQDTNRYSGTILLKAGLTPGKYSRYGGAAGYIIVSDINNSGDDAFGNIDTCILTYYTSFGLRKIIFEVDTLAGLPDTSEFYNDLDSVWKVTDNFHVDYYCADSTEDYAGSDDTLICSLWTVIRIFEE